jgi:hypothetical protein
MVNPLVYIAFQALRACYISNMRTNLTDLNVFR